MLPTSNEIARRMMSEVVEDVSKGVLPRSIASFSELHGFVDANCYGGCEALLDQLDAVAPDTDEGHCGALDQLCELMNPAIEIVDVWLKSGGAASTPLIETPG